MFSKESAANLINRSCFLPIEKKLLVHEFLHNKHLCYTCLKPFFFIKKPIGTTKSTFGIDFGHTMSLCDVISRRFRQRNAVGSNKLQQLHTQNR